MPGGRDPETKPGHVIEPAFVRLVKMDHVSLCRRREG